MVQVPDAQHAAQCRSAAQPERRQVGAAVWDAHPAPRDTSWTAASRGEEPPGQPSAARKARGGG